MKLIEKISEDFLVAYKAKEMEKKNFLGLLKSTVSEKDKNPSDDEVILKIKSMIKVHNKSMEENGAPTLTDLDLEILNSYLPKSMSEEEIDSKLKELVDAGADNIGRIMGGFKGLQADMKMVKTKAELILN